MFDQCSLFQFQITQTRLIALDERLAGRFQGAVNKRFYLRIDFANLVRQRLALLGKALAMLFPKVFEHGVDKFKELARRRCRREQHLKIFFDVRLADRLAVTGTLFIVALIVDVVFATSFSLASCQRTVAIAAKNKATQRHFFAKVLAHSRCGRVGLATSQAILNFTIGVQADDPIMLRFTQLDVPIGTLDIASVKNLGQPFADALNTHFALLCILGKVRLGFEIALHLAEGLQTSVSIAFKRLLKD
ncbi:hypothetical protein CCR85_14220 [Rhodothalassium salexigens]|nr:hypothetical protein [Rhodothalassium salexigens]MBK5912639.1 hypothetical protein [Rhodothalassium salexigens]